MSLLTKFSLRNPMAIVLLSLLVAFGGIYSATKFKQEQLPELSFPGMLVTTVYPGATPAEVLNTVTLPMEKALRGVEGVKNVQSESSNSVSFFFLEFGYGDSMKEKQQEIEEALNKVRLPEGVEEPEVEKAFSSSEEAILYSSVLAKDGTTAEELNDIVKRSVLPALQGIKGVSKVDAIGLEGEGVFIQLDAKKMEQKGVSYEAVSQSLQANNLSIPLGEVTFQKVKQPVLIHGGISSIEDVKNIAIPAGTAGVTIGEIADIKEGKELTVISRTDGKPSVSLNIYKTADANTVEVSDKVLEKYEELEKDYPLKSSIQYDRAVEVKDSVSSMLREGGLGAVFASLLILLFLRNGRATIIAVVSIPLSILVALISLKFFTDVTLNIMTLGGLAIATGRVVDDSIVVIENIVRRLQKEKISKELMISATKEVGTAITSSTITTVAVFAPLAMLQGMTGEVFRPFALTVTFSLLASLVVALTVVPLMSWALMRGHVPKEHGEAYLGKKYKKVLKWALNHKAVVLVLSVALLIGSFPLFGMAGMTFLPETDYKYAFANLTMPKGTELNTVYKEAERIDATIRKQTEVNSSQFTVGNPNNENAANQVEWFIGLTSETNTKDFLQKLRKQIKIGEDSTFDILEDSSNALVAVTITGNHSADIRKATEIVTAAVEKLDGIDNVSNNLREGTKGVEITVRQEDATKYGLSVAQASMMIHPFLSEQQIGRIGDGTSATGLYLALKGTSLASVQDIANLPLGEKLKVSDIADVKEVQLPSALLLKNGADYGSVNASITAKDTNKVNGNLKDTLKKLELPKGVEYSLGGSDEEIGTMMTDMMMAMAVALGMVYIVMVIAFKEARAPFAILFSLPFAAIGGVVGTLLAGEPISISSLIGFLMLIGIVVTNAIVLIERVQQQIEHGLTIREALIEAGGTRLRPILMTAIATVCALLPLGIGMGGGSIISKGLAVIVIGGLTTSTLLTLVIVPIMYELLYFKRSRKERQKQREENALAA